MLPYRIPIATHHSVSGRYDTRRSPCDGNLWNGNPTPNNKTSQCSLTQKWYADDGSVVGKLKDIRAIFDKLTQLGPRYGYLVNPSKFQLLIQPGGERQASTVFAGTYVEITQSARVLGSVIGSSEEKIS